MGLFGGGGGGDGGAAAASQRAADESARAAAEARAREDQRAARVVQGAQAVSDAFAPFNDLFYNARSQAYLDYALPEIARQEQDQRNALTYALADQGILDSGEAARRAAELGRQADMARTQAADTGRQQASDARSQVERARSELLSQNSAAGDPSAVQLSAVQRAASLSPLPAFEPLGPLFQNVVSGLGQYVQGQRGQDLRTQLLGITAPISGQGTQKVVA